MSTAKWRIRKEGRFWCVSAWIAGYGYKECAQVSTYAAALEQIRWRETTTYPERLRQTGLHDVADRVEWENRP